MLANVVDYGARGDDIAVDSAAFQAAIDAVGPGVVHVPAGRYRVTNLMLRSGQTLVGEGRGSVLVRAEQGPNAEPSGGVVLDALSVRGVTIAQLGIDIRASTNYFTSIRIQAAEATPARLSDDVTVRECHLYDSYTGKVRQHRPGDEITIHAVLAQGCQNVRVLDCRTHRTQIKVGSGSNLLVRGNHITQPRNQGISSVLHSETQTFEGVTIVDNEIVDVTGASGIYVGSDYNDRALGRYRGLVLKGNTVLGAWNARGSNAGIIARPCRETEDWIIADNVIRCTAEIPPSNSVGLNVGNVTDCLMRNIVVHGNVIDNLDQWGLVVRGAMRNVVVEGNALARTRGLWCYADDSTGPSRLLIKGNMIEGKGYDGIIAAAWMGDLDALVDGNVVQEMSSGFSSGVRIISRNGHCASVVVSGNRVRGADRGILEDDQGGGVFDSAYVHNDVRTCTTPMAVSPLAYMHENRAA